MNQIIYAIKVADLSYSGLKILNVKIGRTTNLSATLRQYRRTSQEAEILDLWESNPQKTLSECEEGIHKIAEKYAYERKGEVFTFLQESYKKFSENINLLFKNISPDKLTKEKQRMGRVPKDYIYTGTAPSLIKFLGKSYKVNSWRETLHKMATLLYQNHKENFDSILNIRGRKRIYFSKNRNSLVDPKPIEGTAYFFEGNVSANRIMKIINSLLHNFGYKKSDFEVIFHK